MPEYQTIELPEALKEKIYPLVLTMAREAMSGVEKRNELLQMYRDMADGLSQTQNPDLPDGSMVEDPMTTEHVIGNTAHQMGALRYEPYWMIEAEDPADSESAKKLEQSLATKARLWKVRESLYDSRYNANRFPFACAYVYWDRQQKKQRKTIFKGSDGSQVDREEEMLEGVTYTPTPAVYFSKGYDGPRIRTIDPENLVLYPAIAQDIDQATGVGDVMFLTTSDLLMGARAGDDGLGYDKEAVDEMLKDGPNWVNLDKDRDLNELDGLEDTSEPRYYQCLQFICRLPELLDEDGKPELPEHLWGEDFLFMVCPDYDCVFKCEPYAYSLRTYISWNILRVPGRLMGKCVPQMLESLQVELNGLLQYRFSLMNYHANPSVLVPRKEAANWAGKRLKPGTRILYDGPNPDVFKPFTWPTAGVDTLIQGSQELRQRGRELMSAEGVDNMRPRGPDPTATQTNLVAGGVALKRDLFQQNLEEGDERLGMILLSLWLQYMPVEGETLQAGGKTIDVTADDLEKRYRLSAHANTAASNPQMRLQSALMRKDMTLEYFNVLKTTPPPQWTNIYHAYRTLMEESGARDVEAYLNQEPEAGDPEAVLMQITGMLEQAAAAGDPAAQQILQAIPQMAAPQDEGMAELPMPEPSMNGNGAAPQMAGAY